MIKTTASVLLCLGIAGAQAAPVPAARGGRVLEYEASSRLFGRAGVFEPMAEWTQRWQHEELSPYRALTLGSYARVQKRLKLGLFYRLQYGARHDDDWFGDNRGLWAWRDASRRPEHVLVADAAPRTQLSFLPGGSWVGSLRTRLEHNLFNGESALILQPELAWFWMDGLTPRASVFLRQETDLALNFGDRTLWRSWWYLAALWHAASWVSLGPSIALRDEVWSTAASWRSASPAGAQYQTLYRAWVWGFSVIGRLP